MHDKMIINNDKYLVADRSFRNFLSQSTRCSVTEDLTDRGSGIATLKYKHRQLSWQTWRSICSTRSDCIIGMKATFPSVRAAQYSSSQVHLNRRRSMYGVVRLRRLCFQLGPRFCQLESMVQPPQYQPCRHNHHCLLGRSYRRWFLLRRTHCRLFWP